MSMACKLATMVVADVFPMCAYGIGKTSVPISKHWYQRKTLAFWSKPTYRIALVQTSPMA
jgi:hypothetical protein